MKKKLYGSDDVISVYKFMERCGLHCPVKGKNMVSHEIMIRKLKARNKKFSDKVIVPMVINKDRIIKEDVKSGRIILVKDDYKNIKAYSIIEQEPYKNYDKETRDCIRKKLIEEELAKEVDDIIKPGYAKYLYRKQVKKQEQIDICTNDLEDEIEYDVTTKVHRLRKLESYRRRY